MKKKVDLKKISLVKKEPKPIVKKEEEKIDLRTGVKSLDKLLSNGIQPNELICIAAIRQPNHAFKLYDKYVELKCYIKIIFEHIKNLSREDMLSLEKSLEINTFIQDYKFDKLTLDKLRKDEQPRFYPILRIDSAYLENYYGKNFIETINEVEEEDESYKDLSKYVINELHNLMNYRKTSKIVMNKLVFNELYNSFKKIKEDYSDQFILGKKKSYKKSDFNLTPMDIMDENTVYKVVYIVPNKMYKPKNLKITKINSRGIMGAIVIGQDGLPINNRLWNCIAKINIENKVEIPLRCLVPVNLYLKHVKAVKPDKRLFLGLFSNLYKFKDKLHKKISLLLYTTVETYYQRKYL